MLFVLRLLPAYKKTQHKVVLMAFVLNILVTAYACVIYGVSCIPFDANWREMPGSRCMSVNVIVLTNQINAGKSSEHTPSVTLVSCRLATIALSCVCDITTALIPQFLLWNVQMKRRTKQHLSIIFGLSLITAALSIARAATTTRKTLTEDTTCELASEAATS